MKNLKSILFILLCLNIIDSISQTSKDEYLKFINTHPYNTRVKQTPLDFKKYPKIDRPNLRDEFDFLRTFDPNTKTIPYQRTIDVLNKVHKFQQSSKRAINNVNWLEKGPNEIGGRTRAIMFDPNDGNNKKVWAGGVAGGLWFNEDITNSSSQWQNINDFWTNIAITCISYNPVNTQEFFVGTGEGWGNTDAVRGAGVFYTSDGGLNWSQLSSTNNSNFYYVFDIQVSSTGRVFALTSQGLYVSDDSGVSWTKKMSGVFADIEITSDNYIFVSKGKIYSTGAVYRSNDDGENWTTITPAGNAQRIEMAVSPSTSGVIYAIGAYQSSVTWFKKSTDYGANWSDITLPKAVDRNTCTLYTDTYIAKSQAWYDLILQVHPSNSNIVIAGGVDLHKTTDGGTNWSPIGHWTDNCSYAYIHADHHNIQFRPGNSDEVIFANDGGVYYSPDAGSSMTPSFEKRNKNYAVTQLYSCFPQNEALSNTIVMGAQDNGTIKMTNYGVGEGNIVISGDGGFCYIDEDTPNNWFFSYTYNNYYISTNSGNSIGYLSQDNSGDFINNSDYESNNDILYSAGEPDSLIRYADIFNSPVITRIGFDLGGASITHIKVSPYNVTTIFIGTNTGDIYKITSANATPSITQIGDGSSNTDIGTVSSIDIGSSESQILITLSNYGVNSIFETLDGGSNWTNKESNLPDMPVRWGIYNPDNRDEVMLATEVGVWSCHNFSSSPEWEATNSSLANTRCDMLRYRSSDKMVFVATHGRGIFSTDVFATPTAIFTKDKTEWFELMSVNFTDFSIKATSWEWDFNNDGTYESTSQNPSYVYQSPGEYVIKLRINGNDSYIAYDTITILDYPSVPYSNDFEANGGGFTPVTIVDNGKYWEWGACSSSNLKNTYSTINGLYCWATDLDASYASNSIIALETPPFNFVGGTGTYTLKYIHRVISGTDAGYNIEYSIDAGNTWTQLGYFGDPKGTNWYNIENIGGLNNAPGWKYADFTKRYPEYDISEFIGQSDVRFRFVFGALSNIWDGVQIDDFQILGNAIDLCSVTSIINSVSETSICANDTVVFVAQNGTNYTFEWLRNDTLISNEVNDTLAIKIDYNSDYKLVVNDGVCSDTSIVQSISVSTPSILTISGSDSVCSNSIESYSVINNNSTYQWSINGGEILSGNNTNSVTIKWNDENSISPKISVYEITSSQCQGDLYEKSINIFANPISNSIIGNTSVCDNDLIQTYITTEKVNNLSWNISNGDILNGQSNDTIEIDWTGFVDGQIELIETDNLGCQDTSYMSISFLNVPMTSNIAGNSSVCQNSQNQSYYVSENLNSKYIWLVDNGNITSSDSSYLVSIDWLTGNNGKVYVIEKFLNNCLGDTVSYNVNFNASIPLIEFISPIDTVCKNQLGVEYSISPSMGSVYNWSVVGGTIIDSNNYGVTIEWNSLDTGLVIVSEINDKGCTDTTELKVVVSNLSYDSFNLIDASCGGCSDGSIELIFSGGKQPITVSWINEPLLDGNIIQNLTPNDYIFKAFDLNACDTISDTLTISFTTSISSIINENYKIYPNPSSGIFSIEFYNSDLIGEQLIINDINGKLLNSYLIDNNVLRINMIGYSKGIYFINIGNIGIVEKVIVE